MSPIPPRKELLTGDAKEPGIGDCIREVNDHTWIVAGRILIKHHTREDGKVRGPGIPWWPDNKFNWPDWSGSKGYYTLDDAPETPPHSEPLRPNKFIKIIEINDGPNTRVIYWIGGAIFKATVARPNKFVNPTPEHTTLKWLEQENVSARAGVRIPRLIKQYEFDGWSYMFIERLPYRTLRSAWPGMTEAEEEASVRTIANICWNLAEQFKINGRQQSTTNQGGGEGAAIGPRGVDYGQAPDPFLRPHERRIPCTPEAQRMTCEAMGMDCSNLVFAHNDLHGGNVMVDEENMVHGFVDWENAGYVPREWIRTKCQVSAAYKRTGSGDYASRLDEALKRLGFPEATAGYLKWKAEKKDAADDGEQEEST